MSPNVAQKYSIKIAKDGVKRNGFEILSIKDVTLNKIRSIWGDIPRFGQSIDEQVEIDAHYSGYLVKQSNDIASFKKDEGVNIPDELDYESLSGLSNEIKAKLTKIRPRTLGQALRIDGVTPAAAIILLSYIKKSKFKATA